MFILKNDGANIKFTDSFQVVDSDVTVKGDPMTTEVKRGNLSFNEGNFKILDSQGKRRKL